MFANDNERGEGPHISKGKESVDLLTFVTRISSMSRHPLKLARQFLFKPYPHMHNRWIILVLIPLFISLFMVTFQPFGLQMFTHEYKHLLLIGYGMVTFVILALDMYVLPWIFPGLFSEKKWYVLSEILYQLWIVLSIAGGNYLYSTITSISGWRGLNGFIVFAGFTFAIAVIPVLAIIVVSHNVMLRRNLEGAGEVSKLINERRGSNTVHPGIRLSSENKKQQIETTALQLICLESEGNYVDAWIAEEGKIKKKILRNTVKNIESQLKGSDGFFRCHRAYIINLRYVENAEGNSQGYRLKLKYLDFQVPVSRNYTKAFNQVIRTMT